MKEIHQKLFQQVTEKGVNINTEFWKIIKTFHTNERFLSGDEKTLIDKDEVIIEEKINDNYANIIVYGMILWGQANKIKSIK